MKPRDFRMKNIFGIFVFALSVHGGCIQSRYCDNTLGGAIDSFDFQQPPPPRVQPIAHLVNNRPISQLQVYAENKREFQRKYEIMEPLGSGTFGVVSKVRDRDTGEFYALKRSKSMMDSKFLEHESEMLAKIMCKSGRGVVKMKESFRLSTAEFAIIFELMSCDVLHKYENDVNAGRDPRQLIKRILRDILPALKNLKDQGMVHADIKMENILYNSTSKRFKLHDFGFARKAGVHPEATGTPPNISPEIFISRYYSPASDMWALAADMLTMYAQQRVFNVKSDNLLTIPVYWYFWLGPMPQVFEQKLKSKGFIFPDRNAIPQVPFIDQLVPDSDDPLKDFLKRALHYHARTRLKVEDALKHDFLK